MCFYSWKIRLGKWQECRSALTKPALGKYPGELGAYQLA
jgi:hypothetical protein